MKKLFLILFLMLSNLMTSAQEVDTLDFFYLNRSNSIYTKRYEMSTDEKYKEKAKNSYDRLIAKIHNHYQFWDGSNEPIVMVSTKNEFTEKEWTSLFATDYFEIHFAQKYMDTVYLDSMINNGKELFGKYIKANENNKSSDYLKVLEKAKVMLPADDFYLLFAFAEKLKRAICFVRINEEKHKFYIMLTEDQRVSGTEHLDKTYKQLTSSEIPEHYVIQKEFELR